MFAHLSAGQTLRSSSPVSAPETTVLTLKPLVYSGGFALVVQSSGRTVGNLTVSFTWGVNSTTQTYTLGSDLTKVITTAEITYIPFSGPIPPFVKMTLTPAGGFDGLVTITGRYADFNPLDVT